MVVLGSGNLGLVYLMEEKRRLTLEEIEKRHPDLIPALREHPHVGWLLVSSAEHGPVILGPEGARYLSTGRIEDEDPWPRSPRPPLDTSCVRMDSSTSRTSWSAAFMTEIVTKAARSRS